MTRKGRRKPKAPIGDPHDPDGFGVWTRRYLEALRIQNYSERTVENRESYLGVFVTWCEARSLVQPREVTKPILERYQRHLFHLRKDNGKPLSFRAQYARLMPVRGLFKWLARQNVLLWNPASDLDLPRPEHRLPKHVLTASEAEQVLGEPDLKDPLGVRDRAILETFYATGIRRTELIKLGIYDIDTERETVMVRQGKGKKDRVLPLGERALAWVGRYVSEVRTKLVMPPDEGTLFLTNYGEAFSPARLTQMVRNYVKAAELGKTGACHLFRHTMATLMLENGADIRYIQEMLGHAELTTTQIYTQVSIQKLKAVHALTHPGARLEGRAAAQGATRPPLAKAAPAGPPAAEELFSRLAAEDDDETAEDGDETAAGECGT
jgi:integrase/recombinase XerD